jgi:hypothetical protein
MAQSSEQKKSNARMGWVLATIAIAFGLGFIAKMVLLGK